MTQQQTKLTLKLEPELRDAFSLAARSHDQTASQVLRAFMRKYIAETRQQRPTGSMLPQ